MIAAIDAAGALTFLEAVLVIGLLCVAAWLGFHERLWACGAVLVVAIVAAILLFGA